MITQSSAVRIIWKWVIPLGGLGALLLGVYFFLHSPRQRSYRLTMTAGNEVGTRHGLAVRFRDEALSRRITLDLRPSSGSEEALEWVNSRKLDVALVQGGLTPEGRPNVRQAAALQLEPLHLAVKPGLYRDVSTSLSALRGKAVDLDEIGSGTHSLATAVLQFAGLQPRERDAEHGYTAVSIPRQQLFAEPDVTRLPDAVFLVSTLPSVTITFLVNRHGYRLVALPFAEAFALGTLSHAADAPHTAGNGRVVLGRVQAVTIPPYTYGLEPTVPEKALPTIGTRLQLVAHKDVPARAIYELVDSAYSSEFGQIVRPPLDARLMDRPSVSPWHAAAACSP